MADWLATGRLKKLNSNAIGNTFGEAAFESDAGLKYVAESSANEGHRIAHVLKHLEPIPGNTNHTVFDTNDLFGLLDEAYENIKTLGIKPSDPNDAFGFNVPMNKVVGTAGEKFIRLVFDPNTGRVITAFPKP